MNTLLSIVPTPQRVIPSTCVFPLGLSSPQTPSVVRSPMAARGHPYFELLFLEDGEGWYRMGQSEIPAVPGDLFLIPPGEVRDPRGLEQTRNWAIVFEVNALASDQTSSTISLIMLEELLLLSYLRPKSIETGHFRVTPAEYPRWLERLQQLERELRDQPLGFTEAACTLLMLLLIDTARLAAPQIKKCLLQAHPLLVSVFRFIESHYHGQIGLCDVAKAVKRSPAYLTDLVHRETGRTVLSWIIERRMAEARHLLLVTNQAVQQIAEAVGYLDTGHFIRQFRRFNGTTPQAWRNRHRT